MNNIELITPSNFIPLILKSVALQFEDIKNRLSDVTQKSVTNLCLNIDCSNTWKNVMPTASISLSQKKEGLFIGDGKVIINNAYADKYFAYIYSIHCNGIIVNSYNCNRQCSRS